MSALGDRIVENGPARAGGIAWVFERVTAAEFNDLCEELITLRALTATPEFHAEPAVFCASCDHQAHLHRYEAQPELTCIGTGPGRACWCRWSCEAINAASARDWLKALDGGKTA